jgi:hypothetical protein
MRILVMMRMYNFLETSPKFYSHNIQILWTIFFKKIVQIKEEEMGH